MVSELKQKSEVEIVKIKKFTVFIMCLCRVILSDFFINFLCFPGKGRSLPFDFSRTRYKVVLKGRHKCKSLYIGCVYCLIPQNERKTHKTYIFITTDVDK